MFQSLVEEVRHYVEGRDKSKPKRSAVNRMLGRFKQHPDKGLSGKVTRADAARVAGYARDRKNKIAPQLVHNIRQDTGAEKQNASRQEKFKDRTRYDWQKKPKTEGRSKAQQKAGLEKAFHKSGVGYPKGGDARSDVSGRKAEYYGHKRVGQGDNDSPREAWKRRRRGVEGGLKAVMRGQRQERSK